MDDTALSILGQSQVAPRHLGRVLSDVAALDSQPPPIRSLYLHIPFCFHKCHYCDFYSFVDTRDRQEAFTRQLESELALLAPLARGEPLRTIFVGGGTPSLLRVELWKDLLATLGELFDLSNIQTEPTEAFAGEFTVECNPETVTPELMHTLRAGGVTRVSVGAQTFNPQHLQTLERWHDPANVGKAIELARQAGITRQSLDLIYAIPGQTLADLEADLDRAIELGSEHVSAYTLTYEPNTAMTMRMRRGEFEPAAEGLEIEMFDLVESRLASAGLDRYEVSNFAKPGGECRHNLAYWRQSDWLAAGPSASAHVHGHRYKVVPRLGDYLKPFDSPADQVGPPIVDHEPPDARRLLAERLMTAVRLREGFDRSVMLGDADAIGAADRLSQAIKLELELGVLEAIGDRVVPSESGWLVADGIASRLMAAIG